MKEIRGLNIHTFTAAHTSTSCKYNNGVYGLCPWVIQTTLWETVCQRDTCTWLHNRHLALRFCSLKKKKKDKTPRNNQRNKRPHKSFSNFQVIYFFVNFHYKILLLLYGAEMSHCFFFPGICYAYLMWKKNQELSWKGAPA